MDGKRFWRVPSTKRAVFMDDRRILISQSTKRHDFVDRNRGLGNPSTETVFYGRRADFEGPVHEIAGFRGWDKDFWTERVDGQDKVSIFERL